MDRMINQFLQLSLIATISTILSSCSSESSSDNTQTGQFVDSPVQGLTYQTPTQSGVTDANGSFNYLEGEEITFSIGKTTVGTIQSKPTVTLFDFYPDLNITSNFSELKYQLKYEYYWDAFNFNPQDDKLPLHSVLNMAMFLQTLDYDNNPENGIQITEAIQKLFTDTQIDFNQYYPQFLRDLDLSELLNDANASSIFSDFRKITRPWDALNHLYDSNNLNPPAMNSHISFDDDGDGTPENTEQYVFDEQGNFIRVEYDTNNDGIADTIEVPKYDELGNLIELSWDYLNDYESPEPVWKYNQNGNQIFFIKDHFDEDQENSFTAYEYNDANQLIRYSEGYLNPEIVTHSEEWQYNEQGNLVIYTRDDLGDGSDVFTQNNTYSSDQTILERRETFSVAGQIDRQTTTTYSSLKLPTQITKIRYSEGIQSYYETRLYDERGHESRFIEDNNGDNTPDYIVDFTVNMDGLVIQESHDVNADNQIDDIRNYQYDHKGNLTKESYDTDNDGTPDEIAVFSFDDRNNLILEEFDFDGDGQVDSINSYTFDDNNNLIRRAEDYNADGQIDRMRTFTFDGHNNLLEEWSDDNGDGIPEEKEVSTYNPHNLLTHRVRYDENGQSEYIETKVYDSRNNLISHYENFNGDEHSELYQYDENNRVIQKFYDKDSDGVYERQEFYQYDERGNKTYYRDVDTDGGRDQIITQEYSTLGSWRYLFFEIEAGLNNAPNEYLRNQIFNFTN